MLAMGDLIEVSHQVQQCWEPMTGRRHYQEDESLLQHRPWSLCVMLLPTLPWLNRWVALVEDDISRYTQLIEELGAERHSSATCSNANCYCHD